ncbi:hypothetical protein CDEF62S_05145 [Castellaniella defragrans]
MNAVPVIGQNRRVLYAKRPNGKPTLDCFRLEAVPVAEPAEGEVLVRNEYLSVDPYIRMRMEEKDSYAPVMKVGDVLVGRTVGQVVLSRCAGLAEGDWVVGRLGWQDYSVAPAEGVREGLAGRGSPHGLSGGPGVHGSDRVGGLDDVRPARKG